MVKYEIGIVQGTTLNFGRTQLTNGLHILVRFECSGQLEVVGMPKSCTDLWLTGHTFSGLYSVMGTELIESNLNNY